MQVVSMHTAMQDVNTEPTRLDGSTSAPVTPPSAWKRGIRWSAVVVLVAFIALLLQRAQFRSQLTAGDPGLQLADLMRVRDWAMDLAMARMKAAICFAVLGFLVAIALGTSDCSRRWTLRTGRLVAGLLPGAALVVLLALIATGRSPSFPSVLVPTLGYLFGMWIGRTTCRGPWALLRLLPTFALLALLPITTVVAIGVLAVEKETLAFEPPRITAAEKRRLTDLLTDGPPRQADGTRRLRVSEDDANVMLTMGMAQVLSGAKGQMKMDTDSVVGYFSIPLELPSANRRYVNARTQWHLATEGSNLVIRLVECRVGKLVVPGFLLQMVMNRASEIIANDEDLKKIQSSIKSVFVEPGAVEAVLKSQGVVRDVLPSLIARLGRNPDMPEKVRVYFSHLVAEAKGTPKERRLEQLVSVAFELARERSETSDPISENRAAVLALAMLLGHSSVEHLVGPVTDPNLRLDARRYVGQVGLRGRPDWCKHFWVSAALTLVSNEYLTNYAGLFKEESDSAQGGSGFSFSDLLADRAGTRFALAASRNEESARRMQERLAAGFDVGILFPEAADLPEGITDTELESEYGGAGGLKYNAVLEEIERRLDNCEALR